MSADAYMNCPKCKKPNESFVDEPDSEYYGALRVDHEFGGDYFRVSFNCTQEDCDFRFELDPEKLYEWPKS